MQVDEAKGGYRCRLRTNAKLSSSRNSASRKRISGSAAVQVRHTLSERIANLTEHLKTHKKDFGSRRGLLSMVGQRRNLLDYIKAGDEAAYKALIARSACVANYRSLIEFRPLKSNSAGPFFCARTSSSCRIVPGRLAMPGQGNPGISLFAIFGGCVPQQRRDKRSQKKRRART